MEITEDVAGEHSTLSSPIRSVDRIAAVSSVPLGGQVPTLTASFENGPSISIAHNEVFRPNTLRSWEFRCSEAETLQPRRQR